MEISPFLYTPGRALKSSKVLNPNIASQTDPDALMVEYSEGKTQQYYTV